MHKVQFLYSGKKRYGKKNPPVTTKTKRQTFGRYPNSKKKILKQKFFFPNFKREFLAKSTFARVEKNGFISTETLPYA